jgi:hypothetical protein
MAVLTHVGDCRRCWRACRRMSPAAHQHQMPLQVTLSQAGASSRSSPRGAAHPRRRPPQGVLRSQCAPLRRLAVWVAAGVLIAAAALPEPRRQAPRTLSAPPVRLALLAPGQHSSRSPLQSCQRWCCISFTALPSIVLLLHGGCTAELRTSSLGHQHALAACTASCGDAAFSAVLMHCCASILSSIASPAVT